MNIKELCREAHRISESHGFWDGDKCLASKLMLITSELGECLESDRCGNFDGVKEELADCFIRLADLCQHLGIDIEEEIRKKMEFNKSRPMKHGKRY